MCDIDSSISCSNYHLNRVCERSRSTVLLLHIFHISHEEATSGLPGKCSKIIVEEVSDRQTDSMPTDGTRYGLLGKKRQNVQNSLCIPYHARTRTIYTYCIEGGSLPNDRSYVVR